MTTFEDKIVEKLALHKKELAVKQQQLDQTMKEMLEQRERLTAVAEARIEAVVMPRLKHLARQFQNAEIEILHTDAGFISTCRFAHTPQFPATVSLSIELLPASSDQLLARCDLSILPALMEYSQSAEKTLPQGDEESLASGLKIGSLPFWTITSDWKPTRFTKRTTSYWTSFAACISPSFQQLLPWRDTATPTISVRSIAETCF